MNRVYTLKEKLQALREVRAKALKGDWEFVDSDSNQHVITVIRRSKRGPEHDGIKQICALPGFTARSKEFEFIATAANQWLALIDALEKADAALAIIEKGCPTKDMGNLFCTCIENTAQIARADIAAILGAK